MTCRITITAPPGQWVSWKLLDGPDGAWEASGLCPGIDDALEAVQEARAALALAISGHPAARQEKRPSSHPG